MQIRTLTVSSSSKLPHPNADYASTSSMVTLEATLSEEEQCQVAACAKKLQAIADNLVEQHQNAKRQRIATAKPQAATAEKADELAAKHGRKA